MTTGDIEVTPEKPLSGGSRFALASKAGMMILLFYLFTAGSILSLLALLAVEFALTVALARFGAGVLMARAMGKHLAPLPVFLRSLWIRRGVEFRILLQPADAPGLYLILERLCERAKVPLPRSVALEMSANAWVRLRGYRRGAGKTALGIGFDLLAGLSKAEVEAVLAHEMTHARLVQRGLKIWVAGGLNRAVKLAQGLAAQVAAARGARQPAEMLETFLRPADWLARTCARSVAAYSRQDEFVADSGAAQLCGTGLMRAALVKVEQLSGMGARLPWRERVARLQLGEGFSQWLMNELRAEAARPEDRGQAFNPYSTHPPLRDRLAALPAGDGQAATDSPPAMQLLAQPDKVAEKAVAEIQRVAAEEEERDSKQLGRWGRKLRAGSHLRPLQSIGVVAAAVGFAGGLIYWCVAGMSAGLAEFMAATIVPGILCYRFAGYRGRLAMPVPDFALIKAGCAMKSVDVETRAKQVESELRGLLVQQRKKTLQIRLMAAEGIAALEKCDYVKAQVTARLWLERDRKSVDGTLVLAVAAAGLGMRQQVSMALQWIRARTRMVGASTTWGAAWALFLCGDWAHAEAFLGDARRKRPAEPTLQAVLAICQARRGKLLSAIVSARRACTPVPRNNEYAKLLIDLLLDGGFLREAQENLRRLEPGLPNDAELAFSMVRLSLMQHSAVETERWAERFKHLAPGAPSLFRLGAVYEGARQADEAAALYVQALAAGYYPEALLGLGRLAASRHDLQEAQRHMLAALNVNQTPGNGSVGPIAIFQQTIGQLLLLREPLLNCQAWIASFNGGAGPAALAQQSLLIYAPSREQAEDYLNMLLAAMQPGKPPMLPGTFGWHSAPHEQQPIGLVRPGVQGVVV